MAKIDCRWEIPTPEENPIDRAHWDRAQAEAAKLPASSVVVVGLGSPTSVVIRDEAGKEGARLDTIRLGEYAILLEFLRAVVAQRLRP